MDTILRRSLSMLFLLLGMVWLVGCESNDGSMVINLSDKKEPLVVESTGKTLTEVLENSGENVAELKQKYQPDIPWDQELKGKAPEVTLQCQCNVNLHIAGKQVGTYKTTKPTVAAFLKEQKVKLTPWDELKTSPDQKISDGMNVIIDQVTTKVSKEVIETPFEKDEKEDDSLTKGEKEVKKEGKKGKKIYEVMVTYRNGKPVMKEGEPVKTKRLVEEIKPVDQLVMIGTKEEEEEQEQEQEETEETTTPSGRTMNVQATGYTHTGNRTATGTMPKRGTIAVDPSVIPLGTRIYVPGYGYGVAEDTGGVVNGQIIDLFFETRQEAVNWGRRSVQIKILN